MNFLWKLKKLVLFIPQKVMNRLNQNKIQYKIISKNIERSRGCLIPGKYKIIKIGTKIIAYKDTKATRNFMKINELHTARENKRLIIPKIRKVLSFTFDLFLKRNINVDDGDSVKFEGSLIMITREGDKKIFDFINEKVMTTLDSDQEYLRRIINFQNFKRYFTIPKYEIEEIKNTYTEDYIKFIPYSQWNSQEKKRGFKESISNYYNYFQSFNPVDCIQVQVSDIINASQFLLGNEKLKKSLLKLIPKDKLNNFFYQVKSHGDLNFNNILMQNNTYYFIDWEDSKLCLFFHDLLHLIVDTMYVKGDREYINKFLKGDYDQYFAKLFNEFNLVYINEYKLYYIALYLLERLEKYEEKSNDLITNKIIKKYETIINDIEKIYMEYNSY